MSEEWWSTPAGIQSALREEIKIRDARIEELEANALANRVAIMRLETKLAKAVNVGNKMAKSIEGNYYIPGVAKEWRTILAELKGQDDDPA